jgi:uncharacterized membrane protein (UPF0127 family)
MKKIFIIGIICFIAAISIIAVKKENQVCFNEKCFTVELADNPEKRAEGLMFRKSLALDSGMLFIFENEGNYFFWMKNTIIPLDIIWLNKDKEVVYMVDSAQPCVTADCPSLQTTKLALYVLELNAGTAARINLALGDKANIINRGNNIIFSSISNVLHKKD